MKRPTPSEWMEGDGYKKQVVASSDVLQEDAQVQIVEISPDDEVDPHYHEETEEVFFVLQEGGTLVIDGVAVTPEQGEVVVCEPGDVHAVINDSENVFHLLVVKLNNVEEDTIWEV